MNKHFALLTAAASLAMAAPALAEDVSATSNSSVNYDDHGGYTKKSAAEHIDAAGTKTTSDTKVTLDKDKHGNIEKRVETNTTTDPKGLLNKQTEKTVDTVKTIDGKASYETKKTVNGETVVEKKVEAQ